jgi:hypothetical protein
VSESLTYVYCLVRRARRPSLGRVPAGMPGSSGVRALDAGGGLWAVVSSVKARDYDESALAAGLQNLDWVGRRAMAHESVVEHFLGADAVLPMQLFTLFTSDERALDHVARDRSRIDRIVARIEQHVEWGVRLSFDEQKARESVDAAFGRRQRQAPSGTSYLARKRDLLNVSRVHLGDARGEADRLYGAMAREATEARRRPATEQSMPGSRLLLDAAFLVPKPRAKAFASALRRNTRSLAASGIDVSFTGPWPAYNFIDVVAPAATRPARKKTSTATGAPPPTRTAARARTRR